MLFDTQYTIAIIGWLVALTALYLVARKISKRHAFPIATGLVIVVSVALLSWTTDGLPRAPRLEAEGRDDRIAEYFKQAHGDNAVTYRLREPPIKRHVVPSLRDAIVERDGGCIICGSTDQLEVDHMRGLQNGGDNSAENLATLCDECHKEKTRMDNSLRRQREKRKVTHR